MEFIDNLMLNTKYKYIFLVLLVMVVFLHYYKIIRFYYDKLTRKDD
jgi:hypothetical protein